MTREEVVKILTVLQTAYPLFYRSQSNEQLRDTVQLWQTMFADKDYRIVESAVRGLIATRMETYPPTIGSVNEMIQKLTNPEMTEMEAWGYVRKALMNGAYGYKAEWEALPEVVKSAITPDQIHAWATDENFNEEVASSNFMRSFKARQKNNRETDMLPMNLQDMVRIATEKVTAVKQIETQKARPLLPEPEPVKQSGSLRERLNALRVKGE